MHNGFLGLHRTACSTHAILAGLKMDEDWKESSSKAKLGTTHGFIKPTHAQ